MKLFHISDLHIGKQLHYYSLLEDQMNILDQIVDMVREYKPEVLLIAGDIYDKSVPSAEAYHMFDRFLMKLSEIENDLTVCIIAGNHDSPERLKYASSFLERHHIIISVLPPMTEEEVLKKVVLKDEYGEVNIYLLPFVKPGYVRHIFEDGVVSSYDSAIRALISREEIDETKRNVLVSHQFYIAGDNLPQTCESEQIYISVGGLDSVDISTVKGFDYVALGHLHQQQSIGAKHIRYSGTPLKYSVSEEKHNKSISMVTLLQKGELKIESLPLKALRDVRRLKGELDDILSLATDENRHDYLSIILTDEKELYRPKDLLEEQYDHILEVKVENSRTKAQLEQLSENTVFVDPFEAFQEFYQEMQGVPISTEEESIILDVIHSVKGVEME